LADVINKYLLPTFYKKGRNKHYYTHIHVISLVSNCALELLGMQKQGRKQVLKVDKCQFYPSTKHEKGPKSKYHIDIGGSLIEFYEFW
jgi:hypothetical protein